MSGVVVGEAAFGFGVALALIFILLTGLKI
jgi:hypothetical protein